MKPQIKAAVKRQRRKELMLAQQEIAFRKARKQKNRILDAIVEGRIAEDQVMDVSRPGTFVYTARTLPGPIWMRRMWMACCFWRHRGI